MNVRPGFMEEAEAALLQDSLTTLSESRGKNSTRRALHSWLRDFRGRVYRAFAQLRTSSLANSVARETNCPSFLPCDGIIPASFRICETISVSRHIPIKLLAIRIDPGEKRGKG